MASFRDCWGKQQWFLHRRGSSGASAWPCVSCPITAVLLCQGQDETCWLSKVSVHSGTLEVVPEWRPCDLNQGMWVPSALLGCSSLWRVTHRKHLLRAPEGSTHRSNRGAMSKLSLKTWWECLALPSTDSNPLWDIRCEVLLLCSVGLQLSPHDAFSQRKFHISKQVNKTGIHIEHLVITNQRGIHSKAILW